MIELSRHIEILLLKNDCVVVPELGGFIAHYQPARYVEDEGIFLPPMRTIGFNPQLTMNDGLLTQSYMETYHTDFPDANRKIAVKVEELKETLYKEGIVELHGVGELRYNIRGAYEFHSHESGLLSPSLYGLDSFRMPILAEVTADEAENNAESAPVVALPVKEKKEIRLNPHWLGNAVAVAVAAVLFFILSVPVENTYVDKGNYASLGTDCLFDAIRSQSMAATLVGQPVVELPQKKNLKPVAVRVEKVQPATEQVETIQPEVKRTEKVKSEKPKAKVEANKTMVKESKAKAVPAKVPEKKVVQPKKNYHIIVASLPTSSDAQRMLQTFQKQGYADAKVVEGGGRFRIALYSYSDKAVAYQKINDLKQQEAFKSAWMLSSK